MNAPINGDEFQNEQEQETMATDWKLIRRLVNSALDACEALDNMDITDEERSARIRTIDGQEGGSVWDALQSAYIFPENVRYMVIRGRGQLDDASPFVQPVSRVLEQTGALAAELIGAQKLQTPIKGIDPYAFEREQSLESVIQNLTAWYENCLVTQVEQGLAHEREAKHS